MTVTPTERVAHTPQTPRTQPCPTPQGPEQKGISADEVHRAKDSGLAYMRNIHPLLDLSWTRADCERYLRERGFGSTPRSACLGCPYHANRQWRELRDTSPDEWDDVVAFDAAIRAGNARANASGNPLLGQAFLHRSRVPLEQAPIDHITRAERTALHPAEPLRQGASETGVEDVDEDDGFETGCSPWACRSDTAGPGVHDLTRADVDLAA